MSTESSTAPEIKSNLEQARAELAQLRAECNRLGQLNEQLTRTNSQLRSENTQMSQQLYTLTNEREAALAYIHQTRHAPLWGIAIGAGAALVFGGGRGR